jgi:AcrR family transcriptional regulator
LHSRAGNAMQRTRNALLDGAVRAIEKHGVRRTTMADIAALAGVAKGTLYNHFRTKEAVFAAALEAAVRSVAQEAAAAAGRDVVEALTLAAGRVADAPALRRLASDEPAVLAAVVQVPAGGAGAVARAGVEQVLAAGGCATDGAAVDLTLRWLVSFVGQPGGDAEAQARLLATALAPAAPADQGV